VHPFLGVRQGIDGRVQRRLASLLFREDADGKLVARTKMLRAATASSLLARPRDAVSQPRVTRARSDIEGAPDFSDPLPAFVIKAQEDARARRALARAVWVFVGTMVTTVVAGLGMFVVLR
jgi:hypothetical protein